MPKFRVHASVNVTVTGYVTVEAKDEAEAETKALAPAKGFEASAEANGEDEWCSELWQNGNWKKGVCWDQAENFEVFNVEAVPGG